MGIIIARGVIFILLFTGLACFFYHMGKYRVIQKSVKDAYTRLDDVSVIKSRERKQNIASWKPKSSLERFMEKPRRRLMYSGLQNRIPGLTIEIWIVIMLLVSAVVYFITFFVSRSLFTSLVTMAAFVAVVELTMSLLIYKNYKAVGDNLMNFLDMLSNYAGVSGELTYALLQVAKYMPEPLRSALEECYNEARTTGDTHLALISLADKIEHPTFKDIIYNIELSMKYTDNFKEIIYSSRRIVVDERIDQRERLNIIGKESLWIGIISIVVVVMTWYVNEKFLHKQITDVLFGSDVGKIGCGIAIMSYMCFFWKILTVQK